MLEKYYIHGFPVRCESCVQCDRFFMTSSVCLLLW